MITAQVPGLSLLDKYGYKIVKEEQLIRTVEVSGIIPHYDRQRLFGFCWKQDLENPNRFIFDLLLCK
jgi:hypothetical protein